MVDKHWVTDASKRGRWFNVLVYMDKLDRFRPEGSCFYLTVCRAFSPHSIRCSVPYFIVTTSILRSAGRFVGAVRPRDDLEFIAIWIFTSLAKNRGCFVIDTHFLRCL